MYIFKFHTQQEFKNLSFSAAFGQYLLYQKHYFCSAFLLNKFCSGVSRRLLFLPSAVVALCWEGSSHLLSLPESSTMHHKMTYPRLVILQKECTAENQVHNTAGSGNLKASLLDVSSQPMINWNLRRHFYMKEGHHGKENKKWFCEKQMI